MLSGDRPYLVSGADDKLAKVWDYQTKACVQTLEGHSHNVSAVCFHPELPVILTGLHKSAVPHSAVSYDIRIFTTLLYPTCSGYHTASGRHKFAASHVFRASHRHGSAQVCCITDVQPSHITRLRRD